MNNKNQLFLNIYLVIAILHIYSLISGIDQYITLSKYLLMPMLILHVIMNCKNKLRLVIPFLIALFFCWVGDALLIYTYRNEMFFTLGLAAFLIAHVFYFISFRKYVRKEIGIIKKKPWIIIFPSAYAIVMLILIFPSLGNMKIPVSIYTIVITLMVIAAINRYNRTEQYSFLFAMAGALFFIASDSIIAVNKFYTEVQNASLHIMSTYIIAQYLITTGLLLHINDPENDDFYVAEK